MKPLHVGLLVLGAAIAGGLAVKMTQPPPIPSPGKAAVSTPSNPPAAQAPANPVSDSALAAKPAPAQEAAADPAPSAVYEAGAQAPAPDPPAGHAATRKTEPVRRTRAARKPDPFPKKEVARKKEPVQIAQADPLPGAPLPYERPSQPAQPGPQPPVQPTEPPSQAAPVEEPQPEPPAPAPPRQVTLHTGMTIAVRLSESVSSDRGNVGDTFNATLADPVVVDGLVIAERGARATGRIVESQKAGRLSGTSLLELALSNITTSDGQRVAISTDPWSKRGDSSQVQDAEKIGGAAAIGAIIGAIAGGGKGAAIGAGIGGGAGVGAAAATRGKPVNVPTETVLRFRLTSPVTITEQQQ